jgi:7,8-dihydro-6-hydroxymethylpterin-pyrophosphokinase
MAREVKNFTNGVLPGKACLTTSYGWLHAERVSRKSGKVHQRERSEEVIDFDTLLATQYRSAAPFH